MNTNTNEPSELTPLITQPTATTRRSFIKRTASAAMVATFALGAFENEARAEDQGASSWKFTLEVIGFGNPMVIRQRGEPQTILGSLPDPAGEPYVDVTPENMGDDSNVYEQATGWLYSQAPDLEITTYLYDDRNDATSSNFGDHSCTVKYFRVILQSRVVESYPQTTLQYLKNDVLTDEVGFFATAFNFNWKIKVSVALCNKIYVYVQDENGNWALPNPDGAPGNISFDHIDSPAWNDWGWQVQTFDEVESNGSVAINEDTGELFLDPDPVSNPYVYHVDKLEVLSMSLGQVSLRLLTANACDHFAARAELIVASLDEDGNPLPLPADPVSAVSAEVSDAFAWHEVKYQLPRRC